MKFDFRSYVERKYPHLNSINYLSQVQLTDYTLRHIHDMYNEIWDECFDCSPDPNSTRCFLKEGLSQEMLIHLEALRLMEGIMKQIYFIKSGEEWTL